MPRLINLRTIHDPSGDLTPIENTDIPFEIGRVFYLHNLPGGSVRGGHSHHIVREIVVAVSGSFDVITRDVRGRQNWQLNRADVGLYIEPTVWRHLQNFSSNAIALVLASTPYDPADYIHDEAEFVASLPEPEDEFYITPDDIAEAVRTHG